MEMAVSLGPVALYVCVAVSLSGVARQRTCSSGPMCGYSCGPWPCSTHVFVAVGLEQVSSRGHQVFAGWSRLAG